VLFLDQGSVIPDDLIEGLAADLGDTTIGKAAPG
jgi:hypothetical protein